MTLYAYLDAEAHLTIADTDLERVRCAASPREKFLTDWLPYEKTHSVNRDKLADAIDEGWPRDEAFNASMCAWVPGWPLDVPDGVRFEAPRRGLIMTEAVVMLFELGAPVDTLTADAVGEYLLHTDDEVFSVEHGFAVQLLPDDEENEDIDVGPWPLPEKGARVGEAAWSDSDATRAIYPIVSRTTPRVVRLDADTQTRGSFFVPVVAHGSREGRDTLALMVSLDPDRATTLWRFTLTGERIDMGAVDDVQIDVLSRRAYVWARLRDRTATSYGLPLGVVPLGSGAAALGRLDGLVAGALELSSSRLEYQSWATGLR